MNLRNTLCGSIMAIGLTFAIPQVSNANGNVEDLEVKKSNGELLLNVNYDGDYYKVFKNEKLVYEGTSNTYEEEMDFELQKYKIGVYSNDKLEKVFSIKVTNEEESIKPMSLQPTNKDEYISEVIKNTKLQTIVQSDSVSLEWPKLPDEDGIYEVFRDDEKIAETTNQYYTDSDVISDTEYRYSVKIQNELSKESKEKILAESGTEIEEELLKNDGLITSVVFTPANNEAALTEDKIMDPILEAVEEVNKDGIQPMAIPNSNEFTLAYRTFIPYASVPNPNIGSSHKYLKGDNRTGYAAYTDKYRTEAKVYAMLNNPAAVTLYPSVSGTHSCKVSSCSDAKYVGTASTSGIKVNKYTVAKNNLRWSVNHSVPIPLPGKYPNIDYYYLAILTNKSFSASGDHDKAPNHELWMNYPTGEKRIHGFKVSSKTDFWKLFGVKTTWSYDM